MNVRCPKYIEVSGMSEMIYVVAHKQFRGPRLGDGYITIYVGDKIKGFCKEYGLLTDDHLEKENISDKNATFCELTALYWIWKNDIESEFVGLNHYRRFFVSKLDSGKILSRDEIILRLEKKDIILPERLKFHYSIRRFYCMTAGYEKDLLLIEKIIKEKYPDYLYTYHSFLSGREMSYANMFIMSKDKLDVYCAWLFDILLQAEKELDIKGYTQAEKRVFGYIGELLLNVWVIHNELRIDYLQIINTEENIDIKKFFSDKIKKVIKKVIYFPSGIPYRRRLKKKVKR